MDSSTTSIIPTAANGRAKTRLQASIHTEVDAVRPRFHGQVATGPARMFVRKRRLEPEFSATGAMAACGHGTPSAQEQVVLEVATQSRAKRGHLDNLESAANARNPRAIAVASKKEWGAHLFRREIVGGKPWA